MMPLSSGRSRSSSNLNDGDAETGKCTKRAHAIFLKLQRRIPFLKKAAEVALRVPPRWRYAFVLLWFVWKIVLTIALVFLFQKTVRTRGSAMTTNGGILPETMGGPTRVLYIITTLAEYNNGLRATVKDQDRLGEVLIPIMFDNINSMISPRFNLQVDVFLICGYELKEQREEYIRSRLPPGVGLQIWDDASPLGYEKHKSKGNQFVSLNTRALSRQHRYVIKDKIDYYDAFVVFEDDMRITGHHVQHFLEMSQELEKMRLRAPKITINDHVDDPQSMKFFGDMSRDQMDRLVPGFVRVEVLLNETEHGAQQHLDPIPLDYDFNDVLGGSGDQQEVHIDPSICCHVNMEPNIETPKTPKAEDVIIWETNVKAFTLRELPTSPTPRSKFDWAVVMLGPGKRLDQKKLIGGYWSGREGAFGKMDRPTGGPPDLIAQQGGWMATREQILRLNSGLCQGSFLPPFDEPVYYEDGQQSMNVEFWSGSYQFFTGVRGGCNMQRLISVHPDHFSKHLLYHVANNKQRQLKRERMLRADHLFGQFNTVRKQAIRAKLELESAQA